MDAVSFDGKYAVLARLAEMYRQGGFGLAKNPERAGLFRLHLYLFHWFNSSRQRQILMPFWEERRRHRFAVGQRLGVTAVGGE